MKVSNKKIFICTGICLLAAILIFSIFYLMINNTNHNNADNRLITENKEELKSITIQLCDEKGDAEKTIIISDPEYMNSIYDYLSSTNTVINKSDSQIEGNIKILLTYSYAYDDQNGKQDIVFWEAENSFYRYADGDYVFGENADLHNLLTDLLKDVELKMISENQSQPQKITIREYEGSDVKSTLSLTDTESISFIFSGLGTIETKAVLYPGEMSELALDTEYELILEYEDQKNVVVFTGTETAGAFYRYSATVSPSGAEGYVYGKNSALYEFVAALFENEKTTISDSDAE